MKNWFKSGFVVLIILSVAVLLMATAAYAQVTTPRLLNKPSVGQEVKPTCSDGVQNQGELAVDCAGECVISAKEVCDGVDNDRDCLIDEGKVCAPESQPIQVPASQMPDQPVAKGDNANDAVEAAGGVSYGVPAVSGPEYVDVTEPIAEDGESAVEGVRKEKTAFAGQAAASVQNIQSVAKGAPIQEKQKQSLIAKISGFFKRLFR